MRKSKLLWLLLIFLCALSMAETEAPPDQKKKKLTLQDLLNSTSQTPRHQTDAAGVRGLEETNAAVDTRVRDYAAVDRLDHVVIHDDELIKFLREGSLKVKLTKAVGGLSDAEEIQIGREVAANLAARYGLVENVAKVHYVNLVGQAVVRQCERKKIPYHFGILRTSEINALTAPGGYVFITQGLFDSLQDESELAGVLAHEVTHITRQHIVKAIRKANLLGVGQDLASASGHDVSPYAQLTDFSVNLLNKGLSRGDELDADKGGTLLASRTGYDAYGLRRSIERLATQEKTNVLLAGFNKTHPPAADRLKMIDKTIHKNHLPSNGQKLAARFTISRKSRS